jgi:hypothetical protein
MLWAHKYYIVHFISWGHIYVYTHTYMHTGRLNIIFRFKIIVRAAVEPGSFRSVRLSFITQLILLIQLLLSRNAWSHVEFIFRLDWLMTFSVEYLLFQFSKMPVFIFWVIYALARLQGSWWRLQVPAKRWRVSIELLGVTFTMIRSDLSAVSFPISRV